MVNVGIAAVGDSRITSVSTHFRRIAHAGTVILLLRWKWYVPLSTRLPDYRCDEGEHVVSLLERRTTLASRAA